MINSRTPVLQVLTPAGWAFVFCWSVNASRVVTTEDHRKAIRGDAASLSYFQGRSGASEFRVTSAAALASA